MAKNKLERFYELKELATLNFASFDDCEWELRKLDEDLYYKAHLTKFTSESAWNCFEKDLILKNIELSDKIEIGIDFNVVSNPKTHKVSLTGSKYITDGEIITSFTIKDGKIVNISHRKGIVENDLEYAIVNIFRFINPLDLVKLVSKMRDNEIKTINGVKIIRLLNFF